MATFSLRTVLTEDKDLEMNPHGIHSPLKIIFYFCSVYIYGYFKAKKSYCICHSRMLRKTALIRPFTPWKLEVEYGRLFYILITYVPHLYVMYLLLILRHIYKELFNDFTVVSMERMDTTRPMYTEKWICFQFFSLGHKYQILGILKNTRK